MLWPCGMAGCPSECSCGAPLSVEHSLSPAQLPIMRSGTSQPEVCKDVGIEPVLQPLRGETISHKSAIKENEAQLDIAAHVFLARQGWEIVFWFLILMLPRIRKSFSSTYRRHELMKKEHMLRVSEVEHDSFTPVVLSLSDGLGCEATKFYKKLASLLSSKREQPYSITIAWLRCCISFSLLRSSIMCIRGARSSCFFLL